MKLKSKSLLILSLLVLKFSQPLRSAYEKWSQWDTLKSSIDLMKDIQPVHYDVNISIFNPDSRLLKSSAEVFVRVSTPTSSIPLHLDRTVINLNASRIFVRNCQTGKIFKQNKERGIKNGCFRWIYLCQVNCPVSRKTTCCFGFE